MLEEFCTDVMSDLVILLSQCLRKSDFEGLFKHETDVQNSQNMLSNELHVWKDGA